MSLLYLKAKEKSTKSGKYWISSGHVLQIKKEKKKAELNPTKLNLYIFKEK